MYSEQQIKHLQAQTQALLNGTAPTSDAPEQRADLLKRVLRFHEYRYYILNDPLLADGEYDRLFKTLQQLETENPALVSIDSPTQRVGSSVNSQFITTPHLVPMLSLDNSYNAEDLLDFDRKVRELSASDNIEYCIEPKFDGASISLIYEDNLLIRAITRGDGVAGEDITQNIKQIRSIPLHADFAKWGIQQAEIRGEVLMSKTAFANYNNQLEAQQLPPLANPRNAAAGSLRMKDPKDVAERSLDAFLYNVSYYTLYDSSSTPVPLLTHSGSLEMIWDLGLRSPNKEKKVVKGIQEAIDYCLSFEAGRDNLPYEIDGMVVKVNTVSIQEQLGMTSHHPRWAIAFKFKARQATTQLTGIEFQVGRTGAITPVAKLVPLPLGGVTVSSISIHNEEYIREKDLQLGDTVLIERAGDVIPQIVKSLPELRKGTETKIIFPKNCPVCKSELFKEEGEAVWRCINIECSAQVVERIIHFVSKDAMDIKSFGDANVRKFYELGLLKDIPGIYTLNYQEIAQLGGFGKKSIDNLQSAIETSKQQPLNRLIYALGIRFVGETTAKTLANSIDHLLDLKEQSVETLQQLDDIGIKVAASIQHFFSNEQNIEMLKQLETLGLQLKNTKKEPSGNATLSNQLFLFTGTLNKLKRSEAEALAEGLGGQIANGVSSKLNYLVVGTDAGSKLEKAKKINSIKILSEDEFIQLINQQQ